MGTVPACPLPVWGIGPRIGPNTIVLYTHSTRLSPCTSLPGSSTNRLRAPLTFPLQGNIAIDEVIDFFLEKSSQIKVTKCHIFLDFRRRSQSTTAYVERTRLSFSSIKTRIFSLWSNRNKHEEFQRTTSREQETADSLRKCSRCMG